MFLIHDPSGCPERKLSDEETWWGVWLRADAPQKLLGDAQVPLQQRTVSSVRPSSAASGSTQGAMNSGSKGTQPLRTETRGCLNPGTPSSSQLHHPAGERYERDLHNPTYEQRKVDKTDVTTPAADSNSHVFVFNAAFSLSDNVST